MSVVQKFLLGAASLLLTISLIALGMQMFEKSKKVADTMANEQDSILVALEEQGITAEAILTESIARGSVDVYLIVLQ